MFGTKVAVKESENRLILDGPNEVINASITKFRELNEREAVTVFKLFRMPIY